MKSFTESLQSQLAQRVRSNVVYSTALRLNEILSALIHRNRDPKISSHQRR